MSSHTHARRLYIGTSAEKSALSLTADGRGIAWYDTDEDRLYIWSGSAWVEVTKVSELYESDGGGPAWSVGATGNITAAGAYDLTTTGDLSANDITASGYIYMTGATAILPTDSNEPDLGGSASANRWGSIFLASAEQILGQNTLDLSLGLVGSETVFISLITSAQDVLRLGIQPSSGDDIDINFNDEQMYLRGSDGVLGIGIAAASLVTTGVIVEIAEGGVKNAAGGFSDFESASTLEILFSSNSYFGGGSWSVIDSSRGSWWVDLLNNTTDTVDRFSIKYRAQSAAAGAFTSILEANKSGDFAIGASTFPAKLYVKQGSTTAAIPVMYIEQADISEEMFEFSTTIGVGNAIEAVGAKSLTTTHFIKVTLPGALTRYIPCGTIA